jgi:cytochrome c5
MSRAWVAASLFAVGALLAAVTNLAQTAQSTSTGGRMPISEGSEIVNARCLTCHGAELIVQQRLSEDGWAREVEKMISWGAVVDEAENRILVEYLTRHFSHRPDHAATPNAINTGSKVLEARCTTCHGLELISQQRLEAEGWSREVDKMIGWGTSLDADEKSALVHYLSITYGAAR